MKSVFQENFEGIVFHSKDYPEAQVKVTVWCVYDKAQNSVQVIKEDMQKQGQAIESEWFPYCRL